MTMRMQYDSSERPGDLPENICGHFGHVAKRSGRLCGALVLDGHRACAHHRDAGTGPLAASEDMLDPTALHDEIALVTDLIRAQLRSAQLPGFWQRLCTVYSELHQAQAQGNADHLQACLTELGQTIDQGQSEYPLTILGLSLLLETKRSLVETERRWLADHGQLWSPSQVRWYLDRVLAVIRHRVTDPTVLAEIAAEFRDLELPGPRTETMQ